MACLGHVIPLISLIAIICDFLFQPMFIFLSKYFIYLDNFPGYVELIIAMWNNNLDFDHILIFFPIDINVGRYFCAELLYSLQGFAAGLMLSMSFLDLAHNAINSIGFLKGNLWVSYILQCSYNSNLHFYYLIYSCLSW